MKGNLEFCYNFHTFNPAYAPSLKKHKNGVVRRTIKPNFLRVKWSRVGVYTITGLCILFDLAFIAGYLKSQNPDYLVLVVISISAAIALYSVHKDNLTTLKVSQESKSIEEAKVLWTNIIKQIDERDCTFMDGFTRYYRLLKEVERICSEQKKDGASCLAILGTYLAIHDKKSFEFSNEDSEEIWQQLIEVFQIDRYLLRRGLNDFEKLGQGITMGVHDEGVVRAIKGSQACSVFTYFMPYIYARRESHVEGIIKKDQFAANNIKVSKNGREYRAQENNYDFVYEQFEYYAYKWSLNIHPSPYPDFQERLRLTYREMEDAIYRGNELPFIQFAKENEKEVMAIFKDLLQQHDQPTPEYMI